ncbi:MAG: hypothetical protein R3225_00450 [Halofilum sp. (in: g-proteobacteria)]|nr:hypothetical protein [Halofilum sp. (in: g-proteobacteria)]
MNESSGWVGESAISAQNAMGAIIAFLPNLVAAILLGMLGWLVARFARVAVRYLGTRLNGIVERMPLRHSSLFSLSPTAIQVLGNFAFWLVAFLFLIGVATVLELTAVSEWLARLAGYLPAILAGGLIIVIGFAASILLGQLAAAAAAPAGAARSQLLGRFVQGTVLVVAIVLGIGQTGLDMTLPVALIVILVASVGGALTLAFALGARDLVRDLIGAHGLQQHCELHQRVRVDEVEGEIVDLTATGLILATDEGRVLVPGRVFHERAVVVLAPAVDD